MNSVSVFQSLRTAQEVYRALHGVFCIYKPAGKTMRSVVGDLQRKLANDLNSMPVGPPKRILKFAEHGDGSSLPVVASVPDLMDSPLVLGPRYLPEDFSLGFVGPLAKNSSGVTLFGLNRGKRMLPLIECARNLRVYHVTGRLGMATHDSTVYGRIRERSTFRHVSQIKVDRMVAAVQAAHQKLMFVTAGVDIQSQEAYELASQGLLRPKDPKAGAVIYGMKCISFQPPDFTLEVHTINEKCEFLYQLIHNLGLQLKTNAACSQLRRIRYGHCELRHALLKKHWDAHSILDNIALCQSLLTPDTLSHKHQMSPVARIETTSVPLLEGVEE